MNKATRLTAGLAATAALTAGAIHAVSGPEQACSFPLSGLKTEALEDLHVRASKAGFDVDGSRQVDSAGEPVTPANRATSSEWSPVVLPGDRLVVTIEGKNVTTATCGILGGRAVDAVSPQKQ